MKRRSSGGFHGGAPGTVTDEFRLALLCATWPRTEARRDALREAAARPLDWAVFLAIAERHEIVALAHQALAQSPSVPAEIAGILSARRRTLTRRVLEQTAEAVRLCRAFESADIPMAIVKGLPLALAAFGDMSLRFCYDIDLLIPASAKTAATALLQADGYRIERHYNHQRVFFDPVRRKRLDLHWRLARNPRMRPETPPPSHWLERSDGFFLPCLAPRDLLPQLLVHGSMHCWVRLKWLADIGALLASLPPGSVESLVAEAEAGGYERPVAQGLLLANRLLDLPLSPAMADRLNAIPGIATMVDQALAIITAGNGLTDPADLPWGRIRIALSLFRLQTDWGYRSHEIGIFLYNFVYQTLRRSRRLLFPSGGGRK